MKDSAHSLAKYSDTDTFSSSDSDADEVDMADLHMEIELLDKEKRAQMNVKMYDSEEGYRVFS